MLPKLSLSVYSISSNSKNCSVYGISSCFICFLLNPNIVIPPLQSAINKYWPSFDHTTSSIFIFSFENSILINLPVPIFQSDALPVIVDTKTINGIIGWGLRILQWFIKSWFVITILFVNVFVSQTDNVFFANPTIRLSSELKSQFAILYPPWIFGSNFNKFKLSHVPFL